MIFEIDSEELNKGVDNLLNIKTLTDKQEVKSYINRLKVVEAAIKNSEDSFNELFKLHRKLGEPLISKMKNPTSLKFSETGNGFCRQSVKIVHGLRHVPMTSTLAPKRSPRKSMPMAFMVTHSTNID